MMGVRFSIPVPWRKRGRRERGQIMALAALLMTAVIGFAALSVDVGMYMRDLRDAQNDADAAALAGAQELLVDPSDTAAATLKATEWALRNGVSADQLDCCTFTDSNADGDVDSITAAIDRSSDTFFARALGFLDLPVDRDATARVVHAAGAPVCPWGLLGNASDTDPGDGTVFGVVPGQVYALKVATDLQETGNFRGLDLGQTGAAGYKALIEAGCDADDVGVWAAGDEILTDTKPGNMAGPTREALSTYYGYEMSDGTNDSQGFGWCDVSYQLDPQDPTTGHVVGTYNPHQGGVRDGCERNPLTGGIGRVVLIPIIDHLPNGSSEPVEILGIASMYIADWDRDGEGVPPAQTRVYGIFLEEARINPADLVGESDNPLAPLRLKLVE